MVTYAVERLGVLRKHSCHALDKHVPAQSGAEIETTGHDNAANCQTHCRKRMGVRVKEQKGGGGGEGTGGGEGGRRGVHQQKDGGPKEFQEQQPMQR